MTKDEYDAEIEAIGKSQEAIWALALPKFLEMRSCGLGLCGGIDTLEERARTAETADDRGKAKMQIEKERALRELPWERATRAIGQLEITRATLKRLREGLI